MTQEGPAIAQGIKDGFFFLSETHLIQLHIPDCYIQYFYINVDVLDINIFFSDMHQWKQKDW